MYKKGPARGWVKKKILLLSVTLSRDQVNQPRQCARTHAQPYHAFPGKFIPFNSLHVFFAFCSDPIILWIKVSVYSPIFSSVIK